MKIVLLLREKIASHERLSTEKSSTRAFVVKNHFSGILKDNFWLLLYLWIPSCFQWFYLLFAGSIKDEDNQHLWRFLLLRNHLPMLLSWLSVASSKDADTIMDFPELPDTMLTSDDCVPTYTKETLLNMLVKHGFYPEYLLSDMKLLAKYLCRNNMLFAEHHPIDNYRRSIEADERKRLIREFNMQFVCFCEDNDLVLLLWKFISHYR